ncbi:hypothetical protein NM688_g6014 [Phlebia brevispora]|uniref:Uncharacterized protein n=1 Tax=Phlebia brevispora TaxID=194682 RepID=A0ACC1SLA8_9APHY|nr:hypothetical protein NM688_g6014 [Phlebia brevispora]
MPIAQGLAGVDMRLEAGAIRELHWHTADEWAYVLKGSMQVSTVTPQGQNYVGTARQGDLWYFPSGQPHSLQATGDDPEGSEFLLVFDDGNFDESTTFLLTDWMAHIPKEVIAKNFETGIAAWNTIPAHELYIFPAPVPADDQQPPVSPNGPTPEPYTFPLSQMPVKQVAGGTVKIVDSRTFKVAKNIAVAEITVEPGAMRELHWHPTQDEWTYFIEGQGRITLFASGSNARTFDYQVRGRVDSVRSAAYAFAAYKPGDIAYIPSPYGHYVENIGNTTLHFLEVYKTDQYSDVSLSQWLALTPPELVKAHLGISDATLQQLAKFKEEAVVVAPSHPE